MRVVTPTVLALVLAMSTASFAEPLPPTGIPEVDAAIRDERFGEALQLLQPALDRAAADDPRGLLLCTAANLKAANGELEGAVSVLRGALWPAAPVPRMGVALTYVQLLRRYRSYFSSELRGREAVDGPLPDEVKRWTEPQLEGEIWRVLGEAWSRRGALKDTPSSAATWLRSSTYRTGVRDRLRDALSYLVAEILEDRALWSPGQDEEVAALPLAAWADGDSSGWNGALDVGGSHPLAAANGVLADLEAWHLGAGRAEAALEAARRRLLLLHAAAQAPDQVRVRTVLQARAGKAGDVPWKAVALDAVAEMLEGEGDLAAAWTLADTCGSGSGSGSGSGGPDSVGRQRCQIRAQRLAHPELSLQAMVQDGPGRRSLGLEYRNVKRIHFRAWRIPEEMALRSGLAPGGPQGGAQLAPLARGTPVAEWTVDVEDPGDRHRHRAQVAPPLADHGHYVIYASFSPDFAPPSDVDAVTLTLNPWALVREPGEGNDALRIRAVSGDTGASVPGVSVEAWSVGWNHDPVSVGKGITDAAGVASLKVRTNEGLVLVGRRGSESVVLPRQWVGQPHDDWERAGLALVSTDRAVYRPGQKLLWKVVAIRGKGEKRQAAGGAAVTVHLQDAQGNEITKRSGKANRWGSLSGAFDLPHGRMLGDWSLRADVEGGGEAGGASFKVEEYKRPTFEVLVEAPAGEPVLGREVELKATGRYLFGLPVTSGTYRWKVYREPRFPRWWWSWEPLAPSQLVASGRGALDPASKGGAVVVRFTPAEPAGSDASVAWDFRVALEITDEGGETREGQRHLLLGRQPTRVELDLPQALGLSGAPVAGLRALKTTLGGEPRAGQTRWALVRLQPPTAPALPGDLRAPRPETAQKHKHLTGEDLRGGRWDTLPGWQAQVADWPEGAVLAQGALTHDDKGVATFSLPSLEPGVYAVKVLGAGKDELLARQLLPVAGAGLKAPLAFWLQPQQPQARVGETLKLALGAGWSDQPLYVEIRRRGGLERQVLKGNQGVMELPITAQDRGNLRISAWTIRDHQWLSAETTVVVPWEDRQLQVSLESFRDTLEPGQEERWQLRVTGPAGSKAGVSAELVALMYDRALDAFGAHGIPNGAGLWPTLGWGPGPASPFGRHSGGPLQWAARPWDTVPGLGTGDEVRLLDTLVWGGMRGGGMMRRSMVKSGAPAESFSEGAPPPPAAPAAAAPVPGGPPRVKADRKEAAAAPASAGVSTTAAPRQNFAETAFFQPHLVTDKQGRASLRFTVPESVTGWRLLVQAFDQKLRGGSLQAEARTVKRLMVRPYLPRFLREGDEVELRFVVQNNADEALSGEFTLELQDGSTLADAGGRFGLAAPGEKVTLAAGETTTVKRRLKVPVGVGSLRVTAQVRAGNAADGERRELPLLPSLLRLSQSRTAVLDGKGSRALRFEELLSGADKTRTTEQLAVTVDGQLFQAVLEAVPYLVEYPYECSEQTLNRYVSTALLSGTFRRYPAVAAWAKEAARARGDKPLERFDGKDANRATLLEESPWLRESAGGDVPAGRRLHRVLDPEVAEQDRAQALTKLAAAQHPSGGFPWFPGGQPSVYLTSYVLQGFARAAEAGVPLPDEMVARAWGWLGHELEGQDQSWLEDSVFLGYVATAYPEVDSYHPLFERAKRLERAERHFQSWRTFSKRVRAMLALTLHRLGRTADARTVFASVMDGAKTDPLLGTYWAAEDRSWMWFNDTTETHATAMRVLLEIDPSDKRLPGLAHWLMLDKKLGHWKSTRATAEAVDALAHYLSVRGELGVDQAVAVKAGEASRRFVFQAKGGERRQQWVLPGREITQKSGEVTVENLTRGVTLATATWRFTTELPPASGDGDLLSVSRSYYRRELRGTQEVLVPLNVGDVLAVGDEVEEQLSLRARHAAEYVHLRAPRGAGFEPAVQVSGWRWRGGLGFYEEIRDSAENLFFEQLPVGEYTLKLKLRVSTAGAFRVGPATLQSLYAPEFTAYSAGAALTVK